LQVPARDHARIITVLEMWKLNSLQPVVLTLMGSKESRRAYREGITALVRQEIGIAKLRECHLVLLEEEDKESVKGQVSVTLLVEVSRAGD
jgi:hypothetical protein